MPALIVVAALAIVLLPVAWFVRKLALRIVGVEPRRKVIAARAVGEAVELPRSALTLAPGTYGLWFGERFEHHALVGAVERMDDGHVVRRLISAAAPLPNGAFEAHFTGHVTPNPAEIDADWRDVEIPLRDGSTAPAWLLGSSEEESPWVIHVQGIRTSRLVTLRSVDAAKRAGLRSLVITYRGAGDGPRTTVTSLGQQEWSDLADAIEFARAHGARRVYVVAWSMGAGVALELLRRNPRAFDRLALIAPATNWSRIVRNGVERAGLPGFVAPVVTWALGSPSVSRWIGMPEPLDFDRLDWSRDFRVEIPTLVIHSRGDEEIPFELTKAFAAAHPNVTLVETPSAPHGWEANVDPELFQSALSSWLSSAGAESQS
jgi:pimeloyl-ACP methyl ester carboxylesterase